MQKNPRWTKYQDFKAKISITDFLPWAVVRLTVALLVILFCFQFPPFSNNHIFSEVLPLHLKFVCFSPFPKPLWLTYNSFFFLLCYWNSPPRCPSHLCSGFPRKATLGWSWHVGRCAWHPYRQRVREAAMVRCRKGTVMQSQQRSRWSPEILVLSQIAVAKGASLYTNICPPPTYTFRLVTGAKMAQEGHDLRPGSSLLSPEVNSQKDQLKAVSHHCQQEARKLSASVLRRWKCVDSSSQEPLPLRPYSTPVGLSLQFLGKLRAAHSEPGLHLSQLGAAPTALLLPKFYSVFSLNDLSPRALAWSPTASCQNTSKLRGFKQVLGLPWWTSG